MDLILQILRDPMNWLALFIVPVAIVAAVYNHNNKSEEPDKKTKLLEKVKELQKEIEDLP